MESQSDLALYPSISPPLHRSGDEQSAFHRFDSPRPSHPEPSPQAPACSCPLKWHEQKRVGTAVGRALQYGGALLLSTAGLGLVAPALAPAILCGASLAGALAASAGHRLQNKFYSKDPAALAEYRDRFRRQSLAESVRDFGGWPNLLLVANRAELQARVRAEAKDMVLGGILQRHGDEGMRFLAEQGLLRGALDEPLQAEGAGQHQELQQPMLLSLATDGSQHQESRSQEEDAAAETKQNCCANYVNTTQGGPGSQFKSLCAAVPCSSVPDSSTLHSCLPAEEGVFPLIPVVAPSAPSPTSPVPSALAESRDATPVPSSASGPAATSCNTECCASTTASTAPSFYQSHLRAFSPLSELRPPPCVPAPDTDSETTDRESAQQARAPAHRHKKRKREDDGAQAVRKGRGRAECRRVASPQVEGTADEAYQSSGETTLNETQRKQEVCVLCWNHLKTPGYMPCGHTCVCCTCAQKTSRCPMCLEAVHSQNCGRTTGWKIELH